MRSQACSMGRFPLDVIKSRLQVDDLHRPKYRGTLDCLQKVMPGTVLSVL